MDAITATSYCAVLAWASAFVDKEMADKVELRFGVFADARQEADIEERFARAQIAADSVEDDTGNVLGFYE